MKRKSESESVIFHSNACAGAVMFHLIPEVEQRLAFWLDR